MADNYARAYVEVLEILKYLPVEEYAKIPKEKLDFYNKHKDSNYSYTFDDTKPLEEQKISREANAIIIGLFRDYFANELQKEKLEIILNQNQRKYEQELREKYNPNNIFKRKEQILKITETINNDMQLFPYKDNVFTRFLNMIKKIFEK